jgi:Family of unknown function (DUF5677)
MPATEFHNVYKALEPVVEDVRKISLKTDDFYQLALKGAFIKSYEFNTYSSGLESTTRSFFMTATLRGICEDIIILKSIAFFDPKDRSDAVVHIQMSSVYESLINQKQFFDDIRMGQPCIADPDAATKRTDHDDKLLDIYRKYNLLRNNRKPSVRQLALSCGLLQIYDFFYSATSKWVHFAPHILLRMGWSEDTSRDAIHILSTAHFSGYYANFNFIYGTYLFALFFNTFKPELPSANDIEPHINELNQLLNDMLRWPELITFEEMNTKPPSEILYALLRVLADEEAKKNK